ncbi:glycosyltransferase family 39 protein [Albidovulum sp.]|uniref:glycosyltransferase family 39 protein n=1 Tax=Albidovulum sp. TaxID=1872424 RepID=UPI0039B8380F
MRGSTSTDRRWFVLILALATGFRLWHLNAPLWHDEIQTLVTHVHLGWGEMLQSYSMNHHYLHNLAAKLSIALFGEAPWAVRLPAMLFGLATIWATWALAREIAGSAIAHVTALLLALSYHEIWFSQNARGYTGLAFFSTLGLLFFLRGMTAPDRRTWLSFALCLAGAVFTHLTGAFFFVALGLVWLAVVALGAARGTLAAPIVRLPFLGFLVGGAITALLYLPVLPSLLATVSSVSDTSAVDLMKEYQNPLWTAWEAIRTGIGNAGALVPLVGAAVLVLCILGAVSLHRAAPLFAPSVALHILLTTALLMAVGMRIWPRFYFVDIGLLMILIVAGVRLCCTVLGRIAGGERATRALWITGVVLMVLISAWLAKRNYDFPKQDIAGAYAFVEAERKPGDRAIALGYAGQNFAYYGGDWPVIYTDDEYRAALAAPGTVFVVAGFPERVFRDIPQFAADIGLGDGPDVCDPVRPAPTVLKVARCFGGTLGDGNVLVFRRD